ncbi:MAG: tRNA uridine-5-carboxymethylaminomethyl(34) synthesis GTPase MnmE [Chitinispirillales bacterium]|jgi:tRNA modification GTPase|nr:tRNA uridine-5-carboxymethylaminomethyl(34) synthesis GTPase MnmE [Chitinispirillales bacterium]
MSTQSPPIATLSTPPGRGALAAIRLSGDGVHELFVSVIAEKEKFDRESARKIGVYTVIDADNDTKTGSLKIIDEVTAIKYAAPRSFTGEDMVEIFCHGGAVVPQKILDRLFYGGARPAGRGEFSRRAFLNGKMDLLKAESIAGLIDCQTEKHLKSAQLAYQGKQLELLEKLKHRIIDILSDVESRIEFGEDDDVAELGEGRADANRRGLGLIVRELEDELRRGDRVRAFDDGVIVALAGPPNAGKSSLFNEILGYDRSIVHDRPGTTRDIVSERIVFDGVTVKLFDSAGIRDTDDAVERFGIERTMSAIGDAHLVLWVTSADAPFGDGEREAVIDIIGQDNAAPVIIVVNKIDLAAPAEKTRFCEQHSLEYIEASLTEKINTNKLFDKISAAIREIIDTLPSPEIAINDRHRAITALIINDLRDSIENFNREEVAAHYLKASLERLAEFSGHVTGDEVLDSVFGKFCIGK